jgi:hypothetical protein
LVDHKSEEAIFYLYDLTLFDVVFGRAADQWFEEAKERHTNLNAIIYGNIIYAQW